ncbi:MAG: hypothetical protein CMM41_05600 [Rhodospirillaceae bacterium]|nr:hypothetical protein [Rhodospirillaceae bacterium]MBC26669.1 hypothetical protein [Rhodospirillaceae bacterium]|tara:strand:- start:1543 stop:2322 length:780 start_codon:yes stop_codon:yes gene_type:complete
MSWHAAVDYRKAKAGSSSPLPALDYGEVHKVGDDVIIAALSDDIGSIIHPHNAAKVAVKKAITTLLEDSQYLEKLVDCPEVGVATSLFQELCEGVRSALMKQIINDSNTSLVFSPTLIVIIASPAGTIAMRVGDGSIVYRQSGRSYETMFQQDPEDSDPTSIAAPNALEKMEIAFQPGIAEFICASTGGLIPLSIRKTEHRPRAPFFRPLDQCAAMAETDDDIHRGLRTFLRSAPFIDHLKKDCTLMLGGYRSNGYCAA